ncbi:MAG: hypothetical protein ACI9VI_002907 [Candidatus Azotimanducaceae bacterium]|jgi:hypothetical protein
MFDTQNLLKIHLLILAFSNEIQLSRHKVYSISQPSHGSFEDAGEIYQLFSSGVLSPLSINSEREFDQNLLFLVLESETDRHLVYSAVENFSLPKTFSGHIELGAIRFN